MNENILANGKYWIEHVSCMNTRFLYFGGGCFCVVFFLFFETISITRRGVSCFISVAQWPVHDWMHVWHQTGVDFLATSIRQCFVGTSVVRLTADCCVSCCLSYLICIGCGRFRWQFYSYQRDSRPEQNFSL